MMVSYDDLKSAVSGYLVTIPIQNVQQRLTQIAVDRLPGHHAIPPLRAIHASAGALVLRLLEQWTLLSKDKIDILATLCDNFVNCSPHLIDAFNTYKLSQGDGSSCNSVSTPSPSSSSSNLSKSSSAYFCSNNNVASVGLRNCPCSTLPSVIALFPQPSNPQPTRANFSRDTEYQELPREVMRITDYLSQELGSRWLDVGRQLPGMARTTREIDDDCSIRRTRHKIRTLLETHFSEGGDGAMTSLLEALAACDLNKQRNKVKELRSQYATEGLRES